MISRRNIFLIVLFFGVVIVYHAWFSFDVFANADWRFYFSQELQNLSVVSTWIGNMEIGHPEVNFWRAPFFFFYGLFGFFGFDSNVSEKVMMFLPIVFLIPLSAFLVVQLVTKSNTAGFLGALFFSFNSYFVSINTQGHQFLTLSSAFFLFSLYFLLLYFQEKKLIFIISAALSFLVCFVVDLRTAYIALFVVGFLFIWKSFVEKRIFLKPLMFFLGLFFLLILFWLLPFFFGGQISLDDRDILNRGLFGGNFFDFDNALFLAHPFFNGLSVEWFQVQKIPLWMYPLPILAFFGFWLKRKSKDVVFFGIILMFGLLLSSQNNPPFGLLYEYLFKTFPGFNAFREATKFYIVIALSYSILIGAFFVWVWRESNWKKRTKHLVLSGILFISVANSFSILSGEIETMFIPRSIPEDYKKMAFFIGEEREYSRSLWIPVLPRWGYDSYANPSIRGVKIFQGSWDSLLSYNKVGENYPIKDQIIEIFNAFFGNTLFDISSIKYVVVPIQESADGDFFQYYGDRQFFIDELDKIDYLKRIDIGTEELVVYENKDFRPHIYITEREETIYENISFERVEYEFKNPTKYTVNIDNISSPVWVNFSESYHPDWKIRVGAFEWWKVIGNRKYSISDEYHRENDAKLNSFFIDPNVLCKEYDCVKNEDGSYTIDLTLYFQPQSYFYLGGIISGTTLIACVGYLVWYGGRKWLFRRKRNRSKIGL